MTLPNNKSLERYEQEGDYHPDDPRYKSNQAMDFAQFEEGEILFDALHCRDVKIDQVSEKGVDIKEDEVFVQQLREGPPYTIKKRHLFSRDELSTVLVNREIDEELNQIRKERIREKCPLLHNLDFHPDDISEEDIIRLNKIYNNLNHIWKTVQKGIVDIYKDKNMMVRSDDVADAVVKIIRHKQDLSDEPFKRSQ